MLDDKALMKLHELMHPIVVTDREGGITVVNSGGECMKLYSQPFTPLVLSSLDGLLTYLTMGETNEINHLIVVDNYDQVRVVDLQDNRRVMATAIGIRGRSIDNFNNPNLTISYIKHNFQPNDDRQELLSVLSAIESGSKVTKNDDGVIQNIVVETGAATKTSIKPKQSYLLEGLIGFAEAVPPEKDHILRIATDGKCELTEIESPIWAATARTTIAKYLRAGCRYKVAE
jgi:hypothetical protein